MSQYVPFLIITIPWEEGTLEIRRYGECIGGTHLRKLDSCHPLVGPVSPPRWGRSELKLCALPTSPQLCSFPASRFEGRMFGGIVATACACSSLFRGFAGPRPTPLPALYIRRGSVRQNSWYNEVDAPDREAPWSTSGALCVEAQPIGGSTTRASGTGRPSVAGCQS